jgi:hypothetical protein
MEVEYYRLSSVKKKNSLHVATSNKEPLQSLVITKVSGRLLLRNNNHSTNHYNFSNNPLSENIIKKKTIMRIISI